MTQPAQPSNTPFQQPAAALALVPTIPNFEGVAVTSTNSKIAGTAAIQHTGELVVTMDDVVRMVGEYRVVGVAFKVDPKTGETTREHLLKPLKIETCPWDASDPTDDGVVRARPKTP